ncbi:hypothetical protein [Aquincola tertiaricarbonis]|uniref:hypothetical protein n=1 Tax=Aquincola tertiaricarbonis TaxID=391953 RepID=UPI000614C58C|nr:hypothetical protein [Aquincola tertiaricarbonis]
MNGLIAGLSQFNPALAQFNAQQASVANYQAEKQEVEDKRKFAAEGSALGQGIESPRDALTGAPIVPPQTVPSAYADTFVNSVQETLAHRTGVQDKAEVVARYNELKDTEGFNAQAFLTEERSKALAGIKDPRAASIVGSHFVELEAMVRAEDERIRLRRRDEVRASSMAQTAADMFTGNMSPSELASTYGVFQERAKALNYTTKESAQFLLTQLQHESTKLGGSPELFSVFDQKDAEGMTLMARNPQLIPLIDQARHEATKMRDRAIMEGSEIPRTKVLMGIEKQIETDPASVTQDLILSHMGKFGAVQSPGQALSLLSRAQEALAKKTATEAFTADANAGELWRHDAPIQRQVLDSLAGGLVQQMAKATAANDPAAVGQVAHQLMQLHSRTGATEPVDQLQRYVRTLTSNLPNKAGPSSAFQAAGELYKALSANPTYRDMYFNEETSKIMEGYTSAIGAGSDAISAYTQAYQAVSPEAKAAAEAYVKTPAFKAMTQKESHKYVEGTGWLPDWLGGDRADNRTMVGAAVASELRTWRTRNPFATESDARAYVESWTKKNFVLDKTNNVAVRVPPGLGGPLAQEALTNYSAEVGKRFNVGDRNDADWSIQYVPTGTDGKYHVVAFNGAATAALGNVDLQELMVKERAKKVLNDEERELLGQMRDAKKGGVLLPLNPELIAKAEALRILKPAEAKQYREVQQKQLMERIDSTPRMNLGDPSAAALQLAPARKSGNVDNQLTARVAMDLLGSPMYAPQTQHVSLAASLITMGEAVALQPYEDPAHAAGKNIGMGYNLKANEKTVMDDLKRSGVPEERIMDVLDGRAALTPDQAKRLLLTAMPRYEKQVQELAEYASPGLWGRMTPAQKAVMVDVAWQVGDASKFKKAWMALATGDEKTFAAETKVYFTDRSGERKEDTRRNNLRAAMLAGVPYWEATVQKFGSLPSSKLQAMAMQAPAAR